MSLSRIKIILVEDHRVIRASLKLFLNNSPGTEVVGEASHGKELLELLKQVDCTIILLDLDMPVMNGREVLAHVTKKYKDIKVVILSGDNDPATIHECIMAGAKAYLNKNCHENTLLEAIRTVHEKGRWFGEDVAGVLLDGSLNQQLNHNSHALKSLSDRENDVLKLLCKGKTEKEVALALNISHHTVHTHRSHIYQKTGLNNLADLVNYALKSGFL